mgnify:CR=1 FL=1
MTVFLDKEIKTKTIVEFQCQSRNIWTTMEYRTDTQNSYRASVYENNSVKRRKNKVVVTVRKGSLSKTQIMYSTEKTT